MQAFTRVLRDGVNTEQDQAGKGGAGGRACRTGTPRATRWHALGAPALRHAQNRPRLRCCAGVKPRSSEPRAPSSAAHGTPAAGGVHGQRCVRPVVCPAAHSKTKGSHPGPGAVGNLNPREAEAQEKDEIVPTSNLHLPWAT